MTDKQRNFIENIAEQLDIGLPNDYFNWTSKQASENIDDYNLSKRRIKNERILLSINS